MAAYRLLLLLGLGACIGGDADEDVVLAESDVVLTPIGGAADGPSWQPADTLHANTHLFDGAGSNARRVHSMWIAGTSDNPVPMTVKARAPQGFDVRITVLGPIANGTRPVLGADGYSTRKRNTSITFQAKRKGEYLVVVGSYNLERATDYMLSATCTGCAAGRVDILRTPKELALVGDANRLVQMRLGDVMTNRNYDVEVQVWASRPMAHSLAQHVATGVASGNQVNVYLPTSVKPGDDLKLVVREAGGRVLDTGVIARNVQMQTAFARTDAIDYGDLASLQIAGVVGFFEGHAALRLRSETLNRDMATYNATLRHPGQVGNGLSAFDATFEPDFSVAAHDGELLSVGFIDGNGGYQRLGCFEYCNDLAGLGTCTGGPRSCP